MKPVILLLLALTLLLPGCSAPPGPAPSQEEPAPPAGSFTVTAWVDEVDANSMEITAIDYDGFDRAHVSLSQAEIPFNLFPGQKISLELAPEIRETYPPGVTAISAGLLEDADPMRPALNLLEALDESFTLETAADYGCFAVVHGEVKAGQALADAFYARVDAGLPARLLLAQATIEGDPILIALHYDGQRFRGIVDSSRDAYRGDHPQRQEFDYACLRKLETPEGGRYVCLVEDGEVTYEDIMNGLLSSQWGAAIPHQFLYRL